MPKRLILAFVISTSLAFGQLDSNSITVTASRNMNVQPDQVLFGIEVTSGLDTSFDDVLAAVAHTGISAANLQSVYATAQWFQIPTTPPAVQSLEWHFVLPVAWSKMKDTITLLTALQKNIAQRNSALTASFSVQGTQVSPQLQQMQTCPIADLITDARAQAQRLASAANLFTGAILAISSPTSTSSGFGGFLGFYSFSPPCSVTVRFAVTR